jgi:thiamine-monophosphate kinase
MAGMALGPGYEVVTALALEVAHRDFSLSGGLYIVGANVPLNEKALISHIRRSVDRWRGLITGIGDDCAVLRIPAGHEVLVTTDFSIEGVHFRRAWHPPDVVGFRCLARGLSDIAAMGGEPQAAFLSLALPRSLSQDWVNRFMKGLLELACTRSITLAGGDTSESPDGVLADIVVVGSVPRGQAILRSRARSGDRIYVTGELGGAAAALKEFMAGRKPSPKDFPRHFHPDPRVEVGRFLRKQPLASAMIDLSDGLSTDLAHICEESAVGAEILEAAIPRARVGKKGNEVDIDRALHGGEDYELLFTARRGKHVPDRIAGVAVTLIGEITRSRRVVIRSPNGKRSPFQPQGWQHFRK